MKNIALLIIVLFALLFTNCNRKTYSYSGVNHLSSSRDLIKLRSTGYGKKEKDAYHDAEKRALETLMYKGIPNSSQELPLVNNESRESNKEKLKIFFKSNEYKSYIVNSFTASPFIKDEVKGNHITVDLEVNLASLRKYLENNGVIRKFGF